MKQLLTIILILCATVAMGQTKTVNKNADGGWYYRNGGFPAVAGDTILLQGDYAYIEIRNLKGLPSKPIVFLGNGSNKVGYKASNAFILSACSHIVIDGMIVGGANDSSYAEQGFNIQSSDNLEIKNITLQNAKVGFFTNPATGHYPNIFIHHNLIRNISDKLRSNFSEAFYIGKTDGTSPSIVSFQNLRIEDNVLRDIGGDGIQIANGINVSVKRNKIYNYGFHKINSQWFGLLCGGGTSGSFEDNYLEKGTGTPFQILGTGDVTFKYNIAKNTGFGANTQDAFYIRQSFPTLRVRLIGNKVDTKGRDWITEVTPGLIVEELCNVFGSVVTVPTPTPIVPTVTKAYHDSVVNVLQSKLNNIKVIVNN
jgi:hypothetical protein